MTIFEFQDESNFQLTEHIDPHTLPLPWLQKWRPGFVFQGVIISGL